MITTLVVAAALGMPQFDAPPLKPGTMAPAWTAKDANGKTLTLQAELKGRKALLLNFWFYG